MQNKDDFFFIELDMLPPDTIMYPFNIFIYSENTKLHTKYLNGNCPFDKTKRKKLEELITKGAKISVKKSQKNTFLTTTKLKEEDIPGLVKKVHDLELALEQRKKEFLEGDNNQASFKLKSTIKKSIEKNDFMALIEKVKEEVLLFDVKISNSVTMAIKLCNQLLNEDNRINRIVALSYFLAKNSKMDTPDVLSELICSAFLHKIGYTQLDTHFSIKAHIEFSEYEKKDFKKHPGLAQHIIRKSKAEVSDRIMRIIIEHKELAHGEGYPQNKTENQLDPLSLILGISSHIIEYSLGAVTGTPNPNLISIISKIKSKTPSPGLQTDFGEKVIENISNMIDNIEVSNAA